MGHWITNRNPRQGFSVASVAELSLAFQLKDFNESRTGIQCSRLSGPPSANRGTRTIYKFETLKGPGPSNLYVKNLLFYL